MTGLFLPLPDETRKILNRLPGLINETFPLPGRFRAELGRDVAELSRLLTSGRGDRGASYLGKPALLSAYLRYFLPWNVYRLSRLFSFLPPDLKPHDAVNDFGAGPLTLAASLWISRPELRGIPLEFRCLDRTGAILEAGKKFFSALTAALPGKENHSACQWATRTIRGEIRRNGGLSVEIKGKPAALSAAVNVYNELFWELSPRDADGLGRFAEYQSRLLSSLTESSGSILVVEPGIPRSGEFISLLRANLMAKGRIPLSPCTHQGPCPLPGGQGIMSQKAGGKTGGKAKWCHFAFDTEDAPEELHKLSAAANLPKERAVLSFIFATGETRIQKEQKSKLEKIRIISDSFPVTLPHANSRTRLGSSAGNLNGRYGCSEAGLILVTGSRGDLAASPSGALEELQLIKGLKDHKSGAFVAAK